MTKKKKHSAEFQARVALDAIREELTLAELFANEAKPFNWIADRDKIIAARNRGFQMLESIHQRFSPIWVKEFYGFSCCFPACVQNGRTR